MSTPAAPVTARMIGFIDHLRMNDFVVGVPEVEMALGMLARSGSDDVATAREKLKILLTGRREEWSRFDDLFEAYWFARGRERAAAGTANKAAPGLSMIAKGLWRDHLGTSGDTKADSVPGEGDVESGGDVPGRIVASDRTTRDKTDLRRFADPEEAALAERLAYRLARAMRNRLSRRHRRARRGSRLDMRRIIRASLSRGGEPITLVRRAPPDRPVRIVVFLDVSGSMKAYSRIFLQFVKGLVCSWIETDAYLFHTRLIRVTDAVRERDSVKAMTRLAVMVEGFGGGTKLGESLRLFNDTYAKRTINSRTVVLVLSDGYDTGSPELLAGELARLKRRARRLVWLNPLLGWRDYEPVTVAMTAALPFIDHFAAANTLEALAALEPELARL